MCCRRGQTIHRGHMQLGRDYAWDVKVSVCLAIYMSVCPVCPLSIYKIYTCFNLYACLPACLSDWLTDCLSDWLTDWLTIICYYFVNFGFWFLLREYTLEKSNSKSGTLITQIDYTPLPVMEVNNSSDLNEFDRNYRSTLPSCPNEGTDSERKGFVFFYCTK